MYQVIKLNVEEAMKNGEALIWTFDNKDKAEEFFKGEIKLMEEDVENIEGSELIKISEVEYQFDSDQLSSVLKLIEVKEGLEIDATALVARGYTVQISTYSKKYILKDRYNAKKTIKKSEMKNLEIKIILKSLRKSLIEFSLEFD